MSKLQRLLGAVCAPLAVALALGCSQPAGPRASNAAMAGASAGMSETARQVAGGSSGVVGANTGVGTGISNGADAAASTGSALGGGTASGVCPSGYVVCDGVCLEASLMGPDCRPALCPAPAEGTVAPTRTAGVTTRGFDWNVACDATNGTTLTYKAGPVQQPLSPTVAVDLNYRVNGVPAMQTVTLAPQGGGVFTWNTQTLKAGDDLDFYFHQTVGVQTLIGGGGTPASEAAIVTATPPCLCSNGGGSPPPAKPLIDSMWFHQTIGQPPDPEPAYPLTVTLAGRFRDRHPNEERFDHYVDTYFDGPVFALTLVDHGDSVDVTITPTARQIQKDNLSKVDFKHYEVFGAGMGGAIPVPTPLCFTPPELAAIGVSMFYGPKYPANSVQTTVTNLSYGQLLDFELTFVGSRTYYTEMFMYYVGSGRLQPKVQHPWAHAAGDESVTDVTTDQFGYAQHLPNISPSELDDFIAGKVLFEADFANHQGYNPPTTFDCPRGSAPGSMVGQIGVPAVTSPIFLPGSAFTDMALAAVTRPGYTESSCFGCHHLDGKGSPPDGAGMGNMLLKLFNVPAGATSAGPDPTYSTVLDQKAPAGATPEVAASVTWETVTGQYADGTPYSLRRPALSLSSLRDGPLAATTHVSKRIPRPVFGLGLLEAVPEATILANADPSDSNHDGISGRPNMVPDPVTGAPTLGRFGWKAGTASLREQAALAFVNDIGLTSPLFQNHRCGASQTACLSADTGSAQLADTDLDHLQSYMRGLSVPPRRDYSDPVAQQGKALFAGIGCIKCHVANLVTSSTYAIPEMRSLNIQPFTDLLLHDMGPDLADDAPLEEGTATGSEWRTCPLWGNGTGPSVMYPVKDPFDPNGDPPTEPAVYLHDGRAQSIPEAILWHGGEAQAARDLFVAMPASDRAALEAYVKYPFADPIPLRHCPASSPGAGGGPASP